MVPGDVTAVIDTTGFDYIIFAPGAGTLPSAGTATYSVRSAIDAAGTSTAAIGVEAGIHAIASAGTSASSRVTGYLSKLPRYIVINTSAGTAPSLALHVQLRKTNIHAKGR